MEHSLEILAGGQADIPPSLAPKMLAMMKAIDALQTGLEPLTKKPHHEVLAKLNPLERAKVQVMEGYAVNSLFWALMKISTETDTVKVEEDHKVEMKRLKTAQGRLAEIEARATMQRIDREAARRFVQHGLGKPTKRKPDTTKMEIIDDDDIEQTETPKPKKKKQSKIQAEIDGSWQ